MNMTEYALSFTASEIDEKLGAVETLQQRVTDIENDMSNLEGGGGAAGSVSWEDVTNKPFGEERHTTEILAETTITVDVGVGETTAPLIGLTAGAAYRIVWNGTEYTDTAVEASLMGYRAIVVGNTALAGGENSGNYPFLLGDAVEIGMGYFIAEDKNASSHTLSIYQDTTVIKRLDNKYLDFMEINGGVELLPEQTVTLDNEDDMYFLGLFDTTTEQFATMSAGKVGEVYTVVWQGMEYTCEMSTVATDVVLGNLSIGNATATDTGEPFLLALTPTEGLIIACKPDSITEATYDATIHIYQNGEFKIKPEYLPEALQIGEEQNREEILAETTFTLHYISRYGAYGHGFNFSDETPLFPLALGDKCVVYWDGNEYEVTVGDSSAVLADTLYIGNGSGFGLSGNEEPFAIAWDTTGETGVTIFSTLDTEETAHTLSIYQDTTVIKHIDNKYLEILEGEDKIEVEILPEQPITLEADNSGNPTASGFTHLALPEDGTLYSSLYSLEVGQTYTVVWEGIEYTCVAQDRSEFITSISSAAVITKVLSLGNCGLTSSDFEDTGEPFGILLADYTVGDTVNQMATLQAKPGITETSYDVTVCVKQVSGGYKIKPEYLPESASGGSAEIPVFDLAAMGLPALDLNGGQVSLIADMTEVFEALNNGAVTFSLTLGVDGVNTTMYCTMHSSSDGSNVHHCVGAFYVDGIVNLAVLVMPDLLLATTVPISDAIENVNKPATAVDLTAFESEGKVVETRADGSTVTYTMEFDTNGNPTKVTDSNGNVTELTW